MPRIIIREMSFESIASDWIELDDIVLSQKNDWLGSQRSDKIIVASAAAGNSGGPASIPADETHAAPTKRRRTQCRRPQNELVQKETSPRKMQYEGDYNFLDEAVLRDISTDPEISRMMDLISNNEKSMKVEVAAAGYEENYHQGITNHQNIPSKDEFPGEYMFTVELVLHPQGKHWTYSSMLQKVFIDIDQTLPLRFKWIQGQEGLWLRTTMVFSHDQYRNEPVIRCHNHMASENRMNMNIDQRQLQHVVRCTNPTSIYQERGGHLSVLTPLGVPEAGCDYVPLNFQFLCKNSCNSGMNRRPTELIFTLEDQHCNVLGRRKLSVRVCSCPKRDKEKDESECNKVSRGAKKRKMPITKKPSFGNDSSVYKLTIDVPGRENRNQILRFAYNLLAGECVRSNGELQDAFKPYMDDYLRKIQ